MSCVNCNQGASADQLHLRRPDEHPYSHTSPPAADRRWEVIERQQCGERIVENALDAGAQHISVDVGTLAPADCVTDDGRAIAPEDVPLAFRRFATSKIDVARDLESVQTFGLPARLPSIAAVSRVEVLTRPHGAVPDVRPC
jgi:hypothetical protein